MWGVAMIEHVLTGIEWCLQHYLYELQRHGIVPNYPWDLQKIGEEKLRGYDQGMGGEWQIMEQQFVFQWDVLPNTLSDTPNRKPTTLTLLMRAELPIGLYGKPMQSKEAQRRWFIDKMKIEKSTGKKIGQVEEVVVIEAESGDDVMNLIDPPKNSEIPKTTASA